MPLTAADKRVRRKLVKRYGPKKGERIFYALEVKKKQRRRA